MNISPVPFYVLVMCFYCSALCFLNPLLIIPLSTVLRAKRPTPTSIPYWTEPEMKAILVLSASDTLTVKRIPAQAKQRVESTHRVILEPALSLGAFANTSIKFRTPKTMAR